MKKMMGKLKAEEKKKIVFPEGVDERILVAASRLYKEGFLIPVLIGKEDAVKKAAEDASVNIEGLEIVDPETFPNMDILVDEMEALRKGKMTKEQCRDALLQGNYFGTMLVKMGYASGLLGGATYSTADTVRPALQLIKTKPGNSVVSSVFIMIRNTDKGEERYVMGDCAINVDPTSDELVEIAVEAAKTARIFSVEPKVALLSYSSMGSAKGPFVEKVQNAVTKLKEMNLDFPVDGELQFDAAFSPVVGKLKAPNSPVAGEANCFIFPDVTSGNIGYKIAQRFGGFEAIGPIMQGLNAPINDLSRGCVAEEVYQMAIITAALAESCEGGNTSNGGQKKVSPWGF